MGTAEKHVTNIIANKHKKDPKAQSAKSYVQKCKNNKVFPNNY